MNKSFKRNSNCRKIGIVKVLPYQDNNNNNSNNNNNDNDNYLITNKI